MQGLRDAVTAADRLAAFVAEFHGQRAEGIEPLDGLLHPWVR